MDLADSIVRFFDNSPKRQNSLDSFIPEGESRRKLKELCRTRWVERHDSFDVFLLLYQALAHCMEYLSTAPAKEWNRETHNNA